MSIGERMKPYKEILEDLDKKIPRDVVSERDGGGGRRLSYLEGHYVIDRLNKVFGPLNWNKEIVEVKEVVNKTSRGEFPAYLVKLRLTVSVIYIDGSILTSVKEGYGYGADKSSQNAHELAIKEAVTDALKVAAKDLGMSMGLALYSKSQENVGDDDEERRTSAVSHGPKPRQPISKGGDTETKGDAGPKANTDAKASRSLDTLRELIRSEVENGTKLGKISRGEIKDLLLSKYSVERLDELDQTALTEVLAHVKSKI